MSVVSTVRRVMATFDLRRLPHTITAATIRPLLDAIDALLADYQRLRTEVQTLRDELNRLKGEQAQPTFPTKRRSHTAHDSEADRRTRPPQRPRRGPVPTIPATHTEVRRVDPTTLPPDAQFKGYRTIRFRSLRLVVETHRFRCEWWYSPSQQCTIQADLPPGYTGGFTPQTRALALDLAYQAHVSESGIRDLFQTAGLPISTGTIATWLADPSPVAAEASAVLHAGLADPSHVQIDATGTPVNGVPHTCTIVCGDHFTAYQTTPTGDRLAVLGVLQGHGPVDTGALTDLAYAFLLDHTDHTVGPTHLAALRDLPQDTIRPWTELEAALRVFLPRLTDRACQRIRHAAAIGAYTLQTAWPVPRALVCDAAHVYRGLTRICALCWIHEGRHYRKLLPTTAAHRASLARFLRRFWAFYHALAAYRARPSPAQAYLLGRRFDRLFGTRTGYRDLDACIVRTQRRRAGLLAVLDHPTLPLHNNLSELGARRRVRKRDVSFGPRSASGMAAWDGYQTVLATARKLGVNTLTYLTDRLTGQGLVPSLASLVTAAQQTNTSLSLSAATT